MDVKSLALACLLSSVPAFLLAGELEKKPEQRDGVEINRHKSGYGGGGGPVGSAGGGGRPGRAGPPISESPSVPPEDFPGLAGQKQESKEATTPEAVPELPKDVKPPRPSKPEPVRDLQKLQAPPERPGHDRPDVDVGGERIDHGGKESGFMGDHSDTG